MPVILLDGRLASPATTLMKATMGQLASWLKENAPTTPSLTQTVQSCCVFMMLMPRVQTCKCWRTPLILLSLVCLVSFACSGDENRFQQHH